MKTKTYILLIGLILFPSCTFSQATLTGKYEAWFDICDRPYNHFYIQLDIDSTGLVEVTYEDDIQIKKSKGKISFVNDSILLTPLYEIDSVVIDEILDITLNKEQLKLQDEFERMGSRQTVKYVDSIDLPIRNGNNLIRLINGFAHPIANQKITFFSGKNQMDYETDSLGRIIYQSQIPDSIKYHIKGYDFCVKPIKTNNPSWIKIYMDLDNKDMIHDYFDNTSLKLMNGFMVWSWDCPEKKVVRIFKPIEKK